MLAILHFLFLLVFLFLCFCICSFCSSYFPMIFSFNHILFVFSNFIFTKFLSLTAKLTLNVTFHFYYFSFLCCFSYTFHFITMDGKKRRLSAKGPFYSCILLRSQSWPQRFLFYFLGGGWWMVNGGLFSSLNFFILICYLIQIYNNYADQFFCVSFSEEIGDLTPQ